MCSHSGEKGARGVEAQSLIDDSSSVGEGGQAVIGGAPLELVDLLEEGVKGRGMLAQQVYAEG